MSVFIVLNLPLKSNLNLKVGCSAPRGWLTSRMLRQESPERWEVGVVVLRPPVSSTGGLSWLQVGNESG